MKKLLATTFVALLMAGCGEPDLSDPDVVEDATADALDWSKLEDLSGVTYLPNAQEPFSGFAKRTYENKQIEVLAQFKDGYVVRLKQWQENGNPKWDFGYMQGKVGVKDVPFDEASDSNSSHREGLGTQWYENGRKWTEASWKDGEADGLGTVWHENGHKEGEGNFKDGKQNGLWSTWYENGQKQAEGSYKDGNKDGLWAYWYKNGQKELEENYKDGKLDGLEARWYDNGKKKMEVNYKDGKIISAVVWKPNGEKCPESNVKDENGVLVWYSVDGTERGRFGIKDGELVED